MADRIRMRVWRPQSNWPEFLVTYLRGYPEGLERFLLSTSVFVMSPMPSSPLSLEAAARWTQVPSLVPFLPQAGPSDSPREAHPEADSLAQLSRNALPTLCHRTYLLSALQYIYLIPYSPLGPYLTLSSPPHPPTMTLSLLLPADSSTEGSAVTHSLYNVGMSLPSSFPFALSHVTRS